MARWRPALALMTLLLAGAFTELPAALAQSSRPWVDPPPELMAPASPQEHARPPVPSASTPRPREAAPPGAPASSGAGRRPIHPPTSSVRAAQPHDVPRRRDRCLRRPSRLRSRRPIQVRRRTAASLLPKPARRRNSRSRISKSGQRRTHKLWQRHRTSTRRW